MEIEYYINSIDEKYEDIKKNIDALITLPISSIVAPIHHVKFLKKIYNKISFGCFIDYPLAFGLDDNRISQINEAASLGADYVCISVPFHLIINRKYTKFKEEIKKNLNLCISKNINIRYILEYRKFDHQLLSKVCDILMNEGVNCIYPSTGFFLDNIEDNIIACAYLTSKTGIKTIVNGNIWKKDQIDNLLKIKPFGLSMNQITSFYLLDPIHYAK